jgi:hypothetical protein
MHLTRQVNSSPAKCVVKQNVFPGACWVAVLRYMSYNGSVITF